MNYSEKSPTCFLLLTKWDLASFVYDFYRSQNDLLSWIKYRFQDILNIHQSIRNGLLKYQMFFFFFQYIASTKSYRQARYKLNRVRVDSFYKYSCYYKHKFQTYYVIMIYKTILHDKADFLLNLYYEKNTRRHGLRRISI